MKTLDKLITYFEELVSIFCFAAMSIVTIAGVLFRYVLKNPIIWSEEVSRYFMIWGVFIGISIVTRKRAQLGIDIFVNQAPPKFRKVLSIVSDLLLILTYVLLFFLSVEFIQGAIKTGQVTPILRIKFYYVYMALPIGFLLSIYRAVQIFWHAHIKKDDINDGNEEVYL